MDKVIKEFRKELLKKDVGDRIKDDLIIACDSLSPFLETFILKALKEQRESIEKDTIDTIDAEIGCIKDGNALFPAEQDVAINVAENIKTRLKDL